MSERKKITGKSYAVYKWNDTYSPDYSRRRSTQPKKAEKKRSRLSDIALALLVCTAVIVVAFMWMKYQELDELKSSVARRNADVEYQTDYIAALEASIAEATSDTVIRQRATETLNMVPAGDDNSKIVYVPNHDGSILTASAGGR